MKWLVKLLIVVLVTIWIIGCGGSGSASDSVKQKEWQSFKRISRGDGYSYLPKVAIDNSGNAIAVWYQRDEESGYNRAYAKMYEVSSGWSSTNINLRNIEKSAKMPNVLYDVDGNAFIVWIQYDNSSHAKLYVKRYNVRSGFSIITNTLNSGNGNVYDFSMAVNSNLEAVVAWIQRDSSGNKSVYARRYNPTSGWGAIRALETASTEASSPNVAIDEQGNIIDVWIQEDAAGYKSLYKNRYRVGGDWGAATLLEGNPGDVYIAQVAFDDNGNAIVAWTQIDGLDYITVYAKRYNAETGDWSTFSTLERGNSNAYGLRLAIDSSGNGFAVWYQTDISGELNIYYNRYTEDGWGLATPLEDIRGRAQKPEIAISKEGEAVVVWQHRDSDRSHYNIYANH